MWCILVFGYQIPEYTTQHPRRAKTLSYGSLWVVNLKQKTNSVTGGYVQYIIKFFDYLLFLSYTLKVMQLVYVLTYTHRI